MLKLYNKGTNEFLGRISPEKLQFLARHLERESLQDTDFFLRRETLEDLMRAGAPETLIELLRSGMRADPFIEICWREEDGKRW